MFVHLNVYTCVCIYLYVNEMSEKKNFFLLRILYVYIVCLCECVFMFLHLSAYTCVCTEMCSECVFVRKCMYACMCNYLFID